VAGLSIDLQTALAPAFGCYHLWWLPRIPTVGEKSCRKRLVAELKTWVLSPNGERYAVVVGEKGVGKTAAIKTALSEAGNPTVTTVIKNNMSKDDVVAGILKRLAGTSDLAAVKSALGWHKWLGGLTPVVVLTDVGSIGTPHCIFACVA